MSHTFIFYIGAEPSKVWDALTKPEGTRKVFFDCILQSEFTDGSTYAYIGPGNDGPETVHVYGHFISYEENKSMVLIEHPGPSYYENHSELTSRVTMTVEVVGACTKLTLVADQYTENHPSYHKAPDNWSIILSNLKSYVETGNTLDFGW
ncbi:SRPBCC domain-containing protein [Paenibacillus sp. GSMTC-2017]|uniref:SRPBCC domain-containing protein n=1 Tax=Paenibacillus sp. GSMTC-2017 TaxID=2794350 RepID=UPI0018D9FE25|nr:SRPBCC domain-containing protein [Paenibacillus sp. GSMTC-2017]MBH5318628.1 SRPBCC domain-containing protein [Paenibacillus sp. GSMTC-2017]